MNNKVSIVIPTYKYTEYLDRTIASVLNLKYIDASIFVNINSESLEYQRGYL